MTLPVFAPFPPARLRQQIPPDEWDGFLDSWTSLIHIYLSSSTEALAASVQNGGNHVFAFLASVLKEAGGDATLFRYSAREITLRRLCFLLVKRLSECEAVPLSYYDPSFLGDLCVFYSGSPALRDLVEHLWTRRHMDTSPLMVKDKASMISTLTKANGSSPVELEASLRRLMAILKASPSYGLFLMQGSDFLDSLNLAYEKGSQSLKSKLTAILYYSMVSLLQSENMNSSLLLDHLYTLTADHEKHEHSQETSILSSIVCKTPFVHKFRDHSASSGSGRGRSLLQSLASMRTAGNSKFRKLKRRQPNKGKEKDAGHDEVHAHKMSLVTEIQDLFPKLRTSSIVNLLDGFQNDTERVIAYLLDHPVDDVVQKQPDSCVMSSTCNLLACADTI